ncbi:MAG: TonB-dependent receptor [Betaproteobacteria bacterium]|nr:TonB-dependent receptor [Betaproteobacteria bacterium]
MNRIPPSFFLAILYPFACAAQAQTAPAPVEQTLEPIVVTGNPLGNDPFDLAPNASVLEGDKKTMSQKGSLGETLNGVPGISSTYFGPASSRPIIRGLDGDRIRLLQNGVGALDASSLSYDHAVPQDPAATDAIEVVRGPAALLYGGSATGGVINTVDGRIPREPLSGFGGEIDAGYASGSNERSGSAKIELGTAGTEEGQSGLAIHADVFSRSNGELRIPGYAWSAQKRAQGGSESDAKYRLPNSDGRADGGALGASWVWKDGFAGLAYSNYDANYGSVAEAGVRLKMKQDRFAAAGEARNLSGFFQALKFDFAYTDYEHREIENGEIGTIFRNRGYEARLEGRHARMGILDGVLGMQLGQNRFSALGEEAFVPQTDTENAALFLYEEAALSEAFKLNFGGRVEYARHRPDAAGNLRFSGSEERSFTAMSAALGSTWKFTPALSLALGLAYTERAPSFYELYANGEHVATGAFERGNQNLEKERSVSSDIALRFKEGRDSASISAYYQRFRNYIALESTGRFCSTQGGQESCSSSSGGGGLPEYLYHGVQAEFYGFEAEGKKRVFDNRNGWLDLSLGADYTWTKNRNTGEPLPRIAPFRLTGGMTYGNGPWEAALSVQHAAAQNRVPGGESTTDGYTMFGLALSYRFTGAGQSWLLYLRGDNLGNVEARQATSILRDTVPLAGRSVKAGVSVQF